MIEKDTKSTFNSSFGKGGGREARGDVEVGVIHFLGGVVAVLLVSHSYLRKNRHFRAVEPRLIFEI